MTKIIKQNIIISLTKKKKKVSYHNNLFSVLVTKS
jgi:hypothetical protein